jgi:hypothetical protein
MSLQREREARAEATGAYQRDVRLRAAGCHGGNICRMLAFVVERAILRSLTFS